MRLVDGTVGLAAWYGVSVPTVNEHLANIYDLEEHRVQGFVLDDERLASRRGVGVDTFDELLERIRIIRASERRFYQEITDIDARCSVEYDPRADATPRLYATVRNKLHEAVHGRTAAEWVRSPTWGRRRGLSRPG